MDLFKKSKKRPIKLRGFDFIGFHTDYENCCYYKKDLPMDNFELMEVMLEGKSLRKAELGAGTKVQILDAFMSNYLYFKIHKKTIKDEKDFVKKVISNTYSDLDKVQKEGILKKFTSKVPHEVLTSDIYRKAIDKGFEVLYCCNDEGDKRSFGIVNIVLVKDEHLCSSDKRIKLDRHYTIFKPLKYMTTPSYIKGTSKIKYHEEELPQIVVNNDLLEK